MQFEEFERRIVFDQALGAALELEIATVAPASAPDLSSNLPSNIQFRNTVDDFEFASQQLDATALDELLATARAWSHRPSALGIYEIDGTDVLQKGPGHYPPTVTSAGVIVAQRFAENTNSHTMVLARKDGSECFQSGGIYTKQDYHYQFSFDVRHPPSEMSWLTDHSWGIVMELWGPRESGETPRNPPFAIYSTETNGQPNWVVKSYGDGRRTTQSGEFEETHDVRVPMTDIGAWHRFDVEFVPNPFGDGLIRTWLDGELIAEWKDIKNIYHSMIGENASGPLNPSFGLYSSMDEDGMEVHLDNISMQCSGRFQSSLAGVVTGTTKLDGNIVFATNKLTGESFGTYTGSSGVYTLAVPKGPYTVTAVNQETGGQSVGVNVSTASTSQLVDFDVAPQQSPSVTLTGDVTGDGASEIIRRLPDGSWQVSQTSEDGSYHTSTWGQWSANVNWTEIRLADFTGDGREDIAGQVADGNWWIAESTGSGFRNHHWGKWASTVTWTDISVGDFNGDGRSDIAGRQAAGGTWWVSTSTGSRFSTSSWGRWSAAVEWADTTVGDFNGDGLSDIAGRVAADGNWWIATSTGSKFRNRHWGTWYGLIAWSEVEVGDFNGDGFSDLVGRTSDGNWWVAESTGDRFKNRHWGRWSTNVSWSNVTVSDVDGDGRSDLVGRTTSDGSWWVARSNGRRFLNHLWGAIWSPDEDWLVFSVDDFDGDGSADLLGATRHAWLLSL